MSATENVPTNKNFLSPLNFTFMLKRAPHVNFFVQKVNIPEISLPVFNQPSPLLNIPMAGDHISFGTLEVNFKVDEELVNYMEISNWIRALGYPETPIQFREIQKKRKESGESIKSDIVMVISDGIKNPRYEVVYKEAFPTLISSISFQTTDSTVDYVTATAQFRYAYFNIEKL